MVIARVESEPAEKVGWIDLARSQKFQSPGKLSLPRGPVVRNYTGTDSAGSHKPPGAVKLSSAKNVSESRFRNSGSG